MALYFIGIGLSDETDITLKGLNLIKDSDIVYLENYTSVLSVSVSKLEDLYDKKIILADRNLVEKKAEETILKDAQGKKVSFLVVGDPFAATTHFDLLNRAKELNIETKIIHNASILTAIAVTGLQLYKFGKTTSLPFPSKGFEPETHYDALKDNQELNLHTLILLDLNPVENRFMSVNEAIKNLLDIEAKRKENVFDKDTFCIGCANLGSDNQIIKAGTAEQLLKAEFQGLQCLIVPDEMHFVEQEVVQQFKE
ncbi:diphthine synthase [Candidatus Woesearchaeota archaeon]|nr:diphthine synthase [Candidatus Woesearchaeota archaeon]